MHETHDETTGVRDAPRATHEVTNQVPPLVDVNVLTADVALTEAVLRHGGQGALARLTGLGQLAGTARARGWGEQADRYTPVLRTHDAQGNRVDEVEFHPAWHQLLRTGVEHGLGGAPWTSSLAAPHVTRAAGFHVWSQVDAGHACPLSMTYAAVPALRTDPFLADVWVPRLTSTDYDVGLRPAREKAGSLAGMGMTEKQGGSDVRANTTRAVPAPGGPLEGGETYLLTGHKWFLSAPMSDVFLVLAQAPAGLTCFVVPRVLDDGTRNTLRLQRLKDKLGNRSNASSEVELEDTWGARLGEEGRGVRTIVRMVSATRLDTVVGSAATMRAALVRAVHHTRHRHAFGSPLVDKPLMRSVLADLAIESEAATLLGLRLAAAVDDDEQALLRLAVGAAKYWVCKRTPAMVAEALECLGGNGYVEENGVARLFRESPLNSIWEGSGNVNALDVVRVLQGSPASVDAVMTEIGAARGGDRRLDREIESLADVLRSAAEEARRDPGAVEAGARWLVERLAVTLQASLLVRFSPPEVADAFVATRIRGGGGMTFGTLPTSAAAAAAVVQRSLPG
ncbi:MAG: acyl-CoA dehydrogenase family protein [Actinomycetes bacterium]